VSGKSLIILPYFTLSGLRPNLLFKPGLLVLFCSVLFCSVLFCSVLFCSVLFCSVLYFQTKQNFTGIPRYFQVFFTAPGGPQATASPLLSLFSRL
jgi:hypothetical protein